MVFIMAGGNIQQAFQDLRIPQSEAQKVYTAKDDDYEIWSVSENTVNTLFAVPNAKWNSKKWGWWLFAKKPISVNPIGSVEINGVEIRAWVDVCKGGLKFTSLKDYCEKMWNKTSDKAFLDIVTGLSYINGCDLKEFVQYCGE